MRKWLSKFSKQTLKKVGVFELFVFLMVFFGVVVVVKYFGRKPQWRTIRVDVGGRNWKDVWGGDNTKPPFWLSDKIKVDDEERGVDGRVIARILKVENYERSDESADLYLIVSIKGELNKRTGKFVFKGREVEVGAPIEMSFLRVRVLGQVIDDSYPDEGYKKKEFMITGRWERQEACVVKEVKVGEEMIERSSGEVIAEILEVKTELPTSSIFLQSDYRNNVVVDNDPERMDVVIKAKILMERIDDRWFFAGHQGVKVGRAIFIYLANVDMSYVKIESVEEVL